MAATMKHRMHTHPATPSPSNSTNAHYYYRVVTDALIVLHNALVLIMQLCAFLKLMQCISEVATILLSAISLE